MKSRKKEKKERSAKEGKKWNKSEKKEAIQKGRTKGINKNNIQQKRKTAPVSLGGWRPASLYRFRFATVVVC